ncbi:hypothetical protein BKA93DRAFT_824293 [Sparassis latifolia]
MVTFFHDIDVVDRFSPSYRSPTLGFWLEVKPLDCKDNWMSDEGHRTARRDVWSHFAQLNEQAMFAFNHFTGDTFYGMLILGIYFSVFEYLRPTRPPTHPPSPLELHPPTDGNQPQKRQKRKRDHDVSTYRAYVDQEVEPEYFSLTRVHPRTLYYCEPILMNDGEDFNPLFRKALWDIMAWREMDFPFQPSFFTLPSDDYYVSEASLEMAREDRDEFLNYQEQREKEVRDALSSDPLSGEDTSGNYQISARPSNTGAHRRTRSQSRDDALFEADLDISSLDDPDDTDDNAHSEDAISLDLNLNLDRDISDNDGNSNNNDNDDDDENMWQYSRGRLARGRESRH